MGRGEGAELPYDHNIIGEGETENRVQIAAQAQAQARSFITGDTA